MFFATAGADTVGVVIVVIVVIVVVVVVLALLVPLSLINIILIILITLIIIIIILIIIIIVIIILFILIIIIVITTILIITMSSPGHCPSGRGHHCRHQYRPNIYHCQALVRTTVTDLSNPNFAAKQYHHESVNKHAPSAYLTIWQDPPIKDN